MSGPVLLLCNHQSHLDPVLVAVSCRRQIGAMARKSLFFWPLGGLIRSIGAFPVDLEGSGLGGLRTTLKLLKQQKAILIFPEGTRTFDGKLQPLMPGFSALARRTEAVLVPLAIEGAYEAYPRGYFLPRPYRITVRYGKPIFPQEIADCNEKELVERVSTCITTLLDTSGFPA